MNWFQRQAAKALQVMLARQDKLAGRQPGQARLLPEVDLSDMPTGADALRQQADRLMDQENFADASVLYQQLLADHPDDTRVLTSLGFAQTQLGQLATALEHLERAVALQPDNADAHYLLGGLHESANRHGQAALHLRRAVALQPDFDLARRSLGRVLIGSGRLEEARTALLEAVRHSPLFAHHHLLLGNLHLHLGEQAQAAAAYQQVIALEPGLAQAHTSLALAQMSLGQLDAAVASYRAAVAAGATGADTLDALANALQRQGQAEEAATVARQAVAANPLFANAHNTLGNALFDMRQLDAAIASYRQALALEPTMAGAWVNLGHVLNSAQRSDEALVAYERAATLAPDMPWLLGARLATRMGICEWEDLPAMLDELARTIQEGRLAVQPFALLAPPLTAQQQLQAARTYIRSLGLSAIAALPAPPLDRSPGQRLRLAYVSADFHGHATAYLMAQLFELHDRSAFEVIAVSLGPRSTHPMRARLERAFDRFEDLHGLPDTEVAARVRALAPDIAIDLKGFTEDNRLGLFARRLAPLQVGYIGFPGTSGAPFIDYLLADPTVVPADALDAYQEKIAFLPNSYQANDTQREVAGPTPTRAEAGLPDEGFVFCCFNNNYKITPDVFAVWMDILKAVPGSVLWLLQANLPACRNLQAQAQRHGVAAERLVFAERAEMPEHLARQRLADLFLDTWYCNAHTTASDALWVGLPVLTRLGQTFAGRVAGSLVRAAGLPELVVDTAQAYQGLAIALAHSPARLADVRQRLLQQRLSCPLFDTPQLTRHVEAAYQAMWQRHAAGLPPEHIRVPA